MANSAIVTNSIDWVRAAAIANIRAMNLMVLCKSFLIHILDKKATEGLSTKTFDLLFDQFNDLTESLHTKDT